MVKFVSQKSFVVKLVIFIYWITLWSWEIWGYDQLPVPKINFSQFPLNFQFFQFPLTAAPSSSPLVSIDKQQRSSNWRLFHRRWKLKMKNIFLRWRVVADTCHLLQFCATLLNFKCPCLQMLQTFKLANFKSWQDGKESVFILWRIFLWKHVESKWNLFALKSPVKTHLSGDIVNVYVNRGHKSKPTM